MNNITESQAMRNVEKMMRRRKLRTIGIIAGIIVLALVLFMILGTPKSVWTSSSKPIISVDAYEQCPVIEITETEREYITTTQAYFIDLQEVNNETGNVFIYGEDMQSMMDELGLVGTPTSSYYNTQTRHMFLSYYDLHYRYELSVDGENTVTKTVNMPTNGDIGLFQRTYTYLNIDNEYFEKHTRHVDFWETIKTNLNIK